MSDEIRYYSTNRQVEPVTLRQALMRGQAADRGLFLPQRFPELDLETLRPLARRHYGELAAAILGHYVGDMLRPEAHAATCRDAYDFEVPIEAVVDRLHVMRLDRGPTASFKDFAARMMGRWLGALVQQKGGELLILTATSGDTGSAVAHAFHGVEGIRVMVLFPIAEVSNRQRRQMTTIGGNVTTIAVDGKFDDCQAMVKRAFADPELQDIPLTSANSINIGRLLPQSVYYVYAYLMLTEPGSAERITFCVPSGNFGDMMGAIIARRMGVPIERVIIATNSNDEVPRFLETGRYEKIEPSRVCISNAMNVGHPSNLARLVDLYGGRMDETGALHEPPDMDALRRDLFAVSISDERTRQTIRQAHERHGLLLEPHGAVGWAGLQDYLATLPAKSAPLAVSVETAHPAKFPEEIQALLAIDPEVPPALAGLDEKEETCESIAPGYEAFRALLRERFGEA